MWPVVFFMPSKFSVSGTVSEALESNALVKNKINVRRENLDILCYLN